ncbi:hypothetical protein R7431_004177, partial [Aeromonas salmonicida]|nr:hypothetical protein [Aeromonas salmonicida]
HKLTWGNMDNLLDFAEQAVKNKFNVSAPVEKKAEAEKKSPHLAVTSIDQGGAANGRNTPLLLKATVNNEEFNLFCKSMTNEETLLDLYKIVKSDKQLLKNIIIKGNK